MLILTLSFLLALLLGSVNIPFDSLMSLLSESDSQSKDPSIGLILYEIRLPRALMAGLVGACLATSGLTMQTLFKNPLADPGLIGVSSGAALMAAVVLGLAPLFAVEQVSEHLLFISTFLGGLIVCFFVQRLSYGEWGTSVSTMLLAGVGINAIALAFIGLVKTVSDEQGLRSLVFWMLGSINGADWGQVKILALLSLISIVGLLSQSKQLNLLVLGEADAGFLGMEVERSKLVLLMFAALAVAAAVASAGIIAFVGLLVPHFIRQFFGSDHRLLLPASALAGASLLLLSDVLARCLFAPLELPIGVLTALVGGPFFLMMVMRRRANYVLD